MSFEASENNDPSLVFEYAVDSGVWTCSPGILALYGVPHGGLITTEHMLARLLPEDQEPILAMFERTMRDLGPFSCEFRVMDPQGRVRRCVLVGESEGLVGDVKRIAGFMVDISDTLRQGAADAVASSAEHRATIEQAKGAIMATFNVGDEAAFAILQRASQNHNVKLRDVAAGVLHSGTGPAGTRAQVKKWLDHPNRPGAAPEMFQPRADGEHPVQDVLERPGPTARGRDGDDDAARPPAERQQRSG